MQPTSRDKVRAHRARLRRSGLRPIQIWSPSALANVRSRSSKAVYVLAAGRFESDEQAFVDATSEWNPE